MQNVRPLFGQPNDKPTKLLSTIFVDCFYKPSMQHSNVLGKVTHSELFRNVNIKIQTINRVHRTTVTKIQRLSRTITMLFIKDQNDQHKTLILSYNSLQQVFTAKKTLTL